MTPREYRARFNVVWRATAAALNSARTFDPVPMRNYEKVFSWYNQLRESAGQEFPELRGFLPEKAAAEISYGMDGGIGVSRRCLENLLADTRYILDFIDASGVGGNVPEVDREGLFVSGQQFDAFRKIGRIVAAAQRSIWIVDGYVDETVLDLLTSKAPNVEVAVLTFEVKPALKILASSFNQQHGGLSIRTSRGFHDRFLITDDSDFFHFGASLKDAGRRGFMFSRIEEGLVIAALRSAWLAEWSKATKSVGA